MSADMGTWTRWESRETRNTLHHTGERDRERETAQENHRYKKNNLKLGSEPSISLKILCFVCAFTLFLQSETAKIKTSHYETVVKPERWLARHWLFYVATLSATLLLT